MKTMQRANTTTALRTLSVIPSFPSCVVRDLLFLGAAHFLANLLPGNVKSQHSTETKSLLLRVGDTQSWRVIGMGLLEIGSWRSARLTRCSLASPQRITSVAPLLNNKHRWLRQPVARSHTHSQSKGVMNVECPLYLSVYNMNLGDQVFLHARSPPCCLTAPALVMESRRKPAQCQTF